MLYAFRYLLQCSNVGGGEVNIGSMCICERSDAEKCFLRMSGRTRNCLKIYMFTKEVPLSISSKIATSRSWTRVRTFGISLLYVEALFLGMSTRVVRPLNFGQVDDVVNLHFQGKTKNFCILYIYICIYIYSK